MRKTIVTICICGILATVFLSGCHEHKWKEATCTEPKTCTECGDTEGSALGHSSGNWIPAKGSTFFTEGSEVQKCQACDEIINERSIECKPEMVGETEFNFTEEEIINYYNALCNKSKSVFSISPQTTSNFYFKGIDIPLPMHDLKEQNVTIAHLGFLNDDNDMVTAIIIEENNDNILEQAEKLGVISSISIHAENFASLIDDTISSAVREEGYSIVTADSIDIYSGEKITIKEDIHSSENAYAIIEPSNVNFYF